MPFKSRAQFRKFKTLVAQGKISQATMDEWTASTPDLKALPNRLKPKKKAKKEASTSPDSPKTNPDIPPYVDDKPGGWTQGVTPSVDFQKLSFIGGFLKTSSKSLAGTTDAALKRYNQSVIEKIMPNRATKLMERLRDKYPHAFARGVMKTAEPSLSMEANNQSGWSIGDEMPGTQLRNNAETGQFKGKNYRTEGVQNENREMKSSLKQKAQTARGGTNYGGFRDGFSGKNSPKE